MDQKIKHTAVGQGFKGKLNIYTCDCCFGHIVTLDVDYGVTPFMMACKAKIGCRGKMQSSIYRVFDQRMKHTHEWYHPENITDDMSQWEREHWRQGGLFLREANHEEAEARAKVQVEERRRQELAAFKLPPEGDTGQKEEAQK